VVPVPVIEEISESEELSKLQKDEWNVVVDQTQVKSGGKTNEMAGRPDDLKQKDSLSESSFYSQNHATVVVEKEKRDVDDAHESDNAVWSDLSIDLNRLEENDEAVLKLLNISDAGSERPGSGYFSLASRDSPTS